MSDFSKKIELKKQTDTHIYNNSTRKIYLSLSELNNKYKTPNNTLSSLGKELYRVCVFFGIAQPAFPDNINNAEEIMDFLMMETGIMTRKVVLSGNWWKYGAVPLMCNDNEGNSYALIPSNSGGYFYYKDKEIIKVTAKNSTFFNNDCICFYQPMDAKSMSIKDFLFFIFKSFSRSDLIWLLCVSFGACLLGIIMPWINYFVFNSVIPSGTSDEIFGVSVLVFGIVIIQGLCYLSRSLWIMRIGNKMDILAQNAMWARILTLPTDFFKNYTSGELLQKVNAVEDICSILTGELVPTVLGSVFSFVYLVQINSIAPSMISVSVAVVLIIIVVNVLNTVFKIKMIKHNNTVESIISGLVFQLIKGISKIKLCGAEIRGFGKWSDIYSKLKIMPYKLILITEVINTAVIFGGTIVMYYKAYSIGMAASDYIAFNTSFSLFICAVMAIGNVTYQIASIVPALDMIKPILNEKPENSSHKKQLSKIKGDIEINQIKFRYSNDTPYVLDNFNLRIKPGDYIGIVGNSGCGKSTLIRILLGFEKPSSGSVYYDMQSIDNIDIRSLRKRIGVVLQEGKLFCGDIYSNIVISAPWVSVDDAWKAAEIAGFADDIRNMPMGMFTMLSEDGGGISGGQKQRLLIARAIVGKPDILIFDEATSALDNITQKAIEKALENMKCTRIVIAHRLSTIKNCSKIIYIDKGKIAESGNYEELIRLNGKFAQMIKRQIL